MNEQLRILFETQITKEMESAYLYLGMSKYFAEKGLDGIASWFKKQASEEMEHAQKFIDYLTSNEIPFEFHDVKYMRVEYADVKAPFVKQLEHEKLVTSLIFNLYEKAIEVKDLFAVRFLNWFVSEQAEEEATARGLLDKIALLGTEGMGLYQLNKDLSSR